MPLSSLLPLHIITVELRFTHRSTPAFFHQQQLRPWLKGLLGKQSLDDEPRLWLDAPESGRVIYHAGDLYRFCLFCCSGGELKLRRLMALLKDLPDSDPASAGAAPFGGNFRFVRFADYFVPDRQIKHLDDAMVYDQAALQKELAFWRAEQELRLRFYTPARLKLMSAKKDVLPYVHDSGVLSNGMLEYKIRNALSNLIPDYSQPPGQRSCFIETGDTLFWTDAQTRSMDNKPSPFGGALGAIDLKAEGNADEALPWLILGQYVGIGERRNYGYGRYRLENSIGAGTIRERVGLRTVMQRAGDIHNIEKSWQAMTAKHPYYRHYRATPRYAGDEKDDDPLQALAYEGIDQLDDDNHARIDLDQLARDLAAGKLHAAELEGSVLRQPGRHPRPLAVPPLHDRLAQRAVAQILTPAFDKLIYRDNYGYRLGHSRLGARDRIQSLARQGYQWFYEADIDEFFDSVSFTAVENRLLSLLGDDPVTPLIMEWISAAVVFKGQRIERSAGLPQGSPISPLLANLLLGDFDRDMQALGLKLIRFADDFVILCKNRERAELAASRTERSLAELGLTVNLKKTRIGKLDQGFRFLGYTFLNDLVVENKRPKNEPPQPVNLDTLPPRSWLAHLVRKQPGMLNELSQSQKRKITVIKPSPPAPNINIGEQGEIGTTLFVAGNTKLLRSSKGRLVVQGSSTDEILQSLSWSSLASIVIIGRHNLTTPSLFKALAEQTPVHFITAGGQYQGVLSARALTDAGVDLWLAQAQFFTDKNHSLRLAKDIVAARITNQVEVLRQRKQQSSELPNVIKKMRTERRKAQQALDINQLRGHEGHAGALYFRALAKLLPEDFQFDKRIPRNAPDPVNSLLSLGYSILRAHTGAVLQVSGLHPYNGFYHQRRGRHQALASDMMEPYRHMVERAALTLLNRNQLKAEDFIYPQGQGGGCRLSRPAVITWLGELSQRFSTPITGKNSEEKRTLHQHLLAQNRSLIDNFRDPEKPLNCFRVC